MINPFEYGNIPRRFNARLMAENGHWRHYAIDFPVAFPGIFQDSNTAYADYFQPLASGKSPLVILIHGWGDHSALPLRVMARGLARRGVHSLMLYLPFHSRRMSADMKKRSPNLTPDEWFAGYRIGVTDVRQVVDWAQEKGEIDGGRIVVVGLSLGAFTGSIAMGVDRRITAGVFIVIGGNTTKIMEYSRFTVLRRRYRLPREVYEDTQKQYTGYLEEVATRGWDNVEPQERNFFIDPMTYAHRLKTRPLLMLNALWDEFVPREATLDFQHACGDCPLVWFPTTHSTIWVLYPLIASRIYGFLRGALALTE